MDTVAHERAIADFYTEFPYPWRSLRVDQVADAALYPALVGQDLGEYAGGPVPPDGSIWVVGCGVNQAVLTALRFPGARVVGTDVAAGSLALCRETVDQLGVGNLELREESVATAEYQAGFDYIICTGVLHHNREPAPLLERTAGALRPGGVLELMVYNEYHRREPVTFQEAVRVFTGSAHPDGAGGGTGDGTGAADRVAFGRRLAGALTVENVLTRNLAEALAEPPAAFADTWLNPYETGYTVASLDALATRCGLRLAAPCPNAVDKADGALLWELPLRDAQLREQFEALPDLARWQLVNLLLMERSPHLWFYLRHADVPAVTEADRGAAFLDTVFRPVSASQQVWLLGADGRYQRSPAPVRIPAGPPRDYAAVYQLADGRRTIREICGELGLPVTPAAAHRMRIQLATTQYPYLLAVGG